MLTETFRSADTYLGNNASLLGLVAQRLVDVTKAVHSAKPSCSRQVCVLGQA